MRIFRIQKVLLLYLFVQFVDSESDYVENNVAESTTITSQSCDVNYDNFFIESITQLEVLATEATFNVVVQILQNSTNSAFCDNDTLYGFCIPFNSVVVEHFMKFSTVEANSFNWTIEGLEKHTTYTCVFELRNGTGTTSYEKITDITFTTSETDVPSMPRDFYANNVTATSFSLTWSDPAEVRTTLLGYNLTITRTGVVDESHYWSECAGDPEATISVYVDNETYNYEFNEALPHFNYTVDIAAWSTAGLGDSNNLSLSTEVSASKQPENVQWIITEIQESNNVKNSLSLSWDMPCNTNGPVSYFQINLFGSYEYNETVMDNRAFNESITVGDYNFNLEILDLMAASNYQLSLFAINVDGVEGEAYNDSLVTEENYPGEVEDFTFDSSLQFSWKMPSNNPGNVTHYEFTLDYVNLNWEKTHNCVIESDVTENLNENVTAQYYLVTKLIPGTEYNASIAAVTSRGRGNITYLTIISTTTKPQLVNVTYEIQRFLVVENSYDVTSKITIFPGCFNGPFEFYIVNFSGIRSGYNEIGPNEFRIVDWTDTNLTYVLEPEYTYNITVAITNSEFLSEEVAINFTSPAGVPSFDDSNITELSITATTTNAEITLQRSQFSDDAGNIVYLAIIVSSANVTGGNSDSWDGVKWPEATLSDRDDVAYYQATPERWWPFTDSDSVEYVIGENTSCTDEDTICNRPLQPETTYYVLVRAFTANYYRNSMPLIVTTEPLSKLALILGLTISLTLLAVIAFIAFFLWKRGITNFIHKGRFCIVFPRQTRTDYMASDNYRFTKLIGNEITNTRSKTLIANNKFVEHCDYLEQNRSVLKEEWQELRAKTEEMSSVLATDASLLSHNKAKNRYRDVLPYDHTRVKLCCVDEGDETSSDYINASYIKGFSKKNEYIACQGPLECTSRDFWQMIYQENISMIVMLTRFVEKGTKKCFRYFPKHQETLIFHPDIEVKCTMELFFDIYYVRTLQVRKENTQLTVTHMQYMDWPDHGIPDSTKNIISFCHQIRKRWEKEDGMAVVHCSAGVGRTGTIIAIDTLYQALRAGNDVDVFETVLELRSQRMTMVQTEDQYFYIYMTLRDMLLTNFVEENESEHVYENIPPGYICQDISPNVTPAVTENSF